MKMRVVFTAMLSLVVAGCERSSSAAPETHVAEQDEPAIVELGGTLSAPRTLFRGHVYVIKDLLDVEAALTIQPGAIVKFGPYGSLWGHTGPIVAVGTAAEPIVFTSLADDAHGGDTNADGAATTPQPGTYYIQVQADGSAFEHCRILFGGKVASHGGLVLSRPTTVRSSVIAHCDGYPGAIVVDRLGAGSVIDSNVFYANRVPLALSGAATVEGNVFHDPSSAPPYDGQSGNWPNEVRLVPTDPWMAPTTATFAGATVLSVSEVAVVALGNVNLPAGSSLTLPGTVLKLQPGYRISVDGANALGLLDGALVTSWRDEAHGAPAWWTTGAPAPGDWLGVWNAHDGAWIVDARFLYSANSSP
jgi:hypothetical protein